MRLHFTRSALQRMSSRASSPRCHGFRSFSTTIPRRSETERKWSTPLAKQLFEAISITGPVPLASYMRMCLTGDVGGYYTGAIGEGRDQFGTKGDFVTSPEISQIFGELIGIWFIAEWMSQGRPQKGVQLIEVGPGRGTLMDDMLRTIQRFPAMANCIESVIMVEASKELAQTQRKLLCGADAPLTSSKLGQESKSKYNGKPVIWADSIKSLPVEQDKVPFIIAHEFFDALPIHTFQTAPAAPKTTPKHNTTSDKASEPVQTDSPAPGLEWREMMVAPTHPGAMKQAESSKGAAPAEFQLLLSSTPTRHSRFLPGTSPRYQALSQTPDAIIEVCPDASIYATDFAARIGGTAAAPKPTPSGAALILDYGTSDTIPVNSLRGIRNHRIVSPFAEPGLVDLSADVDFTGIAETALLASDGVEVHGPVAQGDFLRGMGIEERAAMLAKGQGAAGDQDLRDRTEKAWRRLVDKGPGGMGKVYKALAILPENDGRRRPAGFGGDVSG